MRYCKFSLYYQLVFYFTDDYLLFSEVLHIVYRSFILLLYLYLNCTRITTLFNN